MDCQLLILMPSNLSVNIFLLQSNVTYYSAAYENTYLEIKPVDHLESKNKIASHIIKACRRNTASSPFIRWTWQTKWWDSCLCRSIFQLSEIFPSYLASMRKYGLIFFMIFQFSLVYGKLDLYWRNVDNKSSIA